jgi:hypothetical protein
MPEIGDSADRASVLQKSMNFQGKANAGIEDKRGTGLV